MSEEDTTQGSDTQALGADDAPQLSEVEQLAAERGWKPKDQFKGNQDDWRPAAEFIRRIPDQRDLKREMGRLREQMDRMTSAHSKSTARALDEQRKEIEAKFATAVENKDTKGAAAAANEMRELERDTAASVPDKPRNYDEEFAQDNPWYGKNKGATAWAQVRSAELGRDKVPVDEQLAIISKEVRKEFPELFDEKADRGNDGGSRVASPSRGGGSRAKGFGDLPSEAKAAANRFAEDAYSRYGNGKDKAAFITNFEKSYAKDYFSEQSA